jgi:hypothetical protein
MRVVRLLALLGVGLIVAACDRGVDAAAAHPHPASSAPAPTRAPALGRLRWGAGETFSGAVTFEEQDRGAVEEELRFTAREQFQIVKVVCGVASIRAAVTGWHWQRNTSALLTTTLPPKTTFGVNAGAEIVAGVDWPLPPELPVPGLDVFASPPGQAVGWTRVDAEGVDLAYQLQSSDQPGQATLTWSVVRPQFTRSGDPITVSGRATVSLVSNYRVRDNTLWLRSTREQATFQRVTTSAAGTTQETGAVLETTIFSAPTG